MSNTTLDIPRRRPVLDGLQPYIQGERSLPGKEIVIKLSANESPYGPSPEARQAYLGAVESIDSYGDGQQTVLRAALAKTHGLPIDSILCGNGSDELISLLIRAFLELGEEIVISENGFVMTSTHAVVAGGKIVSAPERGWTVDVDQVLAAISSRTRIVSICNPNNPAGTFIGESELERLIESVPAHVILHIDEAYAEYAMLDGRFGSALSFRLGRRNLVVTRTFSKAYGLAGLRIGWLVADPLVVDTIDRFRTPFNANTPAQVAAAAATSCSVWLQRVVESNRDVREMFVTRLTGLGLEVIPSITNFVLMRFPVEIGKSGSGAYRALKHQGFVARPAAAGDAYLRISMGTSQQMEDVARIIDHYLADRTLEPATSHGIK